MRNALPARWMPRVLTGLALISVCVGAAQAQPLAPPAPRVPLAPTSSTDSGQADSNEESTNPLGLFEKSSEVIFLLQKDVGKLSSPGWVVVPMGRYEQQQRELARLQKPKEGWSITSVNLQGTLGDISAQLEATIGVRVDDPEGATVDLQLQQAHCAGATSDAGELPSIQRQQGSGPYRLVIDKPGVYKYTLQLSVDIDRSPTGRRLQLTLPFAPVKSAQLTCKEELLSPQAGETGLKYVVEPDRRTIRPPLRQEDSLDITWRTASDRETGGLAAYAVNGAIEYRLDLSSVETTAELTIDGQIESRDWSFLLPAEETVKSVTAEKTRLVDPDNKVRKPLELTYDVVAEKDQTRLRVQFAEPVTGQVKLEVVSVRPIVLREPMPVGRFEMVGAESQVGNIFVYTGSDLSVRFKPKTELPRSAAVQMDPAIQRSSSLRAAQPLRAYQYYSQPVVLDLVIEEAQPIITATSHTNVHLSMDSAQVTTQFRFSIRKAHTEKLTLSVPFEMSGIEVTPSELVEMEIRPQQAKRIKEVLLSLVEPTIHDLELTLKGTLPLKEGKVNDVRLPGLMNGPAIVDTAGTLEVGVASNVRMSLTPEATKGLVRQPPPASAGSSSEPLWFFRRQSGEPQLSFTLQRLPQEIQAAIDSRIEQIPTGIRVHSHLRFRAAHEAMEQVTLKIPNGLADLKVAGTKLALEAAKPSEAGARVIPLVNPTDQCDVTVDYLLLLEKNPPESASIPLILPEGATIDSFRAEVFCDDDRQAAVSAPWQAEAPPVFDEDQTAPRPSLVIRSTAPAAAMELRFEPTVSLATLVIPRVAVEEVMSSTGERRGRKRMLIAKYRRSTIRVAVPENGELLTVLVNGQWADVAQEEPGVGLVRLPPGTEPLSLEFDYRVWQNRTMGAWNNLTLETPTILDDAAVEEVRWLFQAPKGQLLLGAAPGIWSEMTWQFTGFLRNPVSRSSPASMTDWLRSADPNIRWADDQWPEVGTIWAFHTWGDAGSLQVICLREVLWILLWSGVTLLAGLGLSHLPVINRVRVAAVVLVVALALVATLPQIAVWIWLGAQWGFYLLALMFAAQALVRRRRRQAYRLGRSLPAPAKLSVSMSTLLRKLQVEGAANQGKVGSTMDHG